MHNDEDSIMRRKVAGHSFLLVSGRVDL
jgi:hypothetical protein